MSVIKAYDALEKRWKRVAGLSDSISMLSWDSQTFMPSGASEARAEQLATLSVLRHEEIASPMVSELINSIDDQELSLWKRANLREIKRAHHHACMLSSELVDTHSRLRNSCEAVWRTARKDNRFDLVVKPLTELLKVTRDISAAKAAALNVTSYEALLDEYEPGASNEKINSIFRQLEPTLAQLLPEVIEYQKRFKIKTREAFISIDKQRNLGLKLMQLQGFNFANGRLDTSEHPFSGGVPDDVRITTRYNEKEWSSSLMGVIHETGHALYEQGLPTGWRGQPVGAAKGMVLHESQSLALEMQVCRSKEFFKFLSAMILEEFEVQGEEWSADALYLKSIKVIPNFIRVDADELTYPLHIIMRYRIEQSLLEGDLTVKDLPLAWNDNFERSFGIRPTNDRDGCLQDIHWYDGAFGYFPTYTLGAMAAAQLFWAASQDVPELEADFSNGNFTRLLGWFRKNVHSWGSYYSTETLLEESTGHALDPEFFISHLRRRYLTDN